MKRLLCLLLTFNLWGAEIPKLNPIRRLLCHLRGGDYLHPGDSEAIDIVIQQALQFEPNLKQKTVLDIGCGYGGTINYLHAVGFTSLIGIDFDESAIMYAKHTYPAFKFVDGNALHVDQIYQGQEFGFISLFNVIYAIADKNSLLKSLNHVSQPGTILAIWDYTQTINHRDLNDATSSIMHPLEINNFICLSKEHGWELLSISDQTTYFKSSYQDTLQQMEQRKAELINLFGTTVFEKTLTIYAQIFAALENGNLGGILMLVRKR